MGNRYDLPAETHGVAYFASSLVAGFGEVLARFRPDPKLAAVLKADQGFMDHGGVPRDWRYRRSAVRIIVDPAIEFLDVESAPTVDHLRDELALGLASLGYDDLSDEMIHGRDRRVTRLISAWTYAQHDATGRARYGGIRYLSWLNAEWECWSIFGDVVDGVTVAETRPITLDMPELVEVAGKYGITVH